MQWLTAAHRQTLQQYSRCALEGRSVKLKLSVTVQSAWGQRSLSAVKCQTLSVTSWQLELWQSGQSNEYNSDDCSLMSVCLRVRSYRRTTVARVWSGLSVTGLSASFVQLISANEPCQRTKWGTELSGWMRNTMPLFYSLERFYISSVLRHHRLLPRAPLPKSISQLW